MSNTKQESSEPSPAEALPKEEEPPQSALVEVPSLPAVSLLKRARGGVARLFQFKNTNGSIEEEVAELIEEHDPDGTQVGSEERSILHNVLSLSDSTVSDVMIPRADIAAVEENVTLEDLKNIIIEKEHTRTPIYKDSLDNVIGFVHIKDVIPFLGTDKPFSLTSILREILYVPPSMKVVDLLVKMRSKRVHMALVLDEYGGTDGLVTLEDLVEEIVGEIEDEHDEQEPQEVRAIDEKTYEVNARVAVEELEKLLGVTLMKEDEEDFETLGGLIFFLLGHVPEVGEIAEHAASGLSFEVLEADERSVKTLLVRRIG